LQLGHFEGGHVSFNAAPDASAIAWLTAGHEVWAVLRQNPGGDVGGGGDGMPTYCAPQKCTPCSTVYSTVAPGRKMQAGVAADVLLGTLLKPRLVSTFYHLSACTSDSRNTSICPRAYPPDAPFPAGLHAPLGWGRPVAHQWSPDGRRCALLVLSDAFGAGALSQTLDCQTMKTLHRDVLDSDPACACCCWLSPASSHTR